MKILFITSTRIGDAVLSTSVLHRFLNDYPYADVTIACGSLPASLFSDLVPEHKIIVLHNKRNMSHWLMLWRRTFWTRWDIVIDLRGSAIGYVLWTKKRYIWRSASTCAHRVVQLQNLIKSKTPLLPALTLDKKRSLNIQRTYPLLDHTIAIAPFANWHGKEWPLSSFKILIHRLLDLSGSLLPKPLKFTFLCAPHEQKRLISLTEALPPDSILHLPPTDDLLEVAALLHSCYAFIGNDSGLMHIAAASGIPTLGLFGPSRAEHYAPYGRWTAFARTQENYEDLMALFKSNPHSVLMSSLTPESVYNAFIALLHNKPNEAQE